ncbi:MAG TPA: ATP-binding protein [Candidatus Polarisedimenticolia bacterium]|nr:ATP-binding protein [Candidatus Polarisedimenticolia bacterium]
MASIYRVPASRNGVAEAAPVFTSRKDLHRPSPLALARRRAYASNMAQTDCPICQGSGWKVVERTTAGAQALSTDRPGTGASGEPKLVWAVPCDCTAGDRTDKLLAKARVPERYRHCDFDNFETDNEIENASRDQLQTWNRSLAQAKLLVERFAEEFPVGSEHGLLLMGPCGVGKTHLAVAALKKIVLRGHAGLFYDYRELLKEIQGSYNAESQSTEMGVLDPVLKAEILVLDDVGSSKPSLWALETVGHILNTRYNERRVTLLTTNFLDAEANPASPSAPPRVAGQRVPAIEDSLTDRVGKRIRSRLYEMCRTVEVFASDYRKEIRNISRFRA